MDPTAIREPTPREPMPPKAAARFAAAFRALLRSIAIRTVRKPRPAAASVTIKISGTGEENRTPVRVAPSECLAGTLGLPTRFRYSPIGIYGILGRIADHSALMLAARITLAHFSVSVTMNLAKSK